MPAAGEYLFNLICFMTDFNRHSTGIQQAFLKSLTGEFPQSGEFPQNLSVFLAKVL